jgi:hypothetical protein
MFLPKKSNLSTESEKDLQLSIRRKQEDIGRWVRFSLASHYPCFAFGKDYQLMISEIQCNDPSCVPIETLIVVVFDDSSYVARCVSPLQYSTKILKPLFEVILQDIMSMEWPFEILDKSILNFILSTKASMVKTLVPAMDNERQEKGVLLQQIFRTFSDNSLRIDTNSSEGQESKFQPELTLIDFVLHEELKKKEEEKMQRTRFEEEERAKSLQEANNNITVVKMKKISPVIPSQPETITLVKGKQDSSTKPRHEKGRTMRGCPCCDPDNLDNKIDKMMFLDIPPN